MARADVPAGLGAHDFWGRGGAVLDWLRGVVWEKFYCASSDEPSPCLTQECQHHAPDMGTMCVFSSVSRVNVCDDHDCHQGPGLFHHRKCPPSASNLPTLDWGEPSRLRKLVLSFIFF